MQPTPYQQRFVDHILAIYDLWNKADPALALNCAKELAAIDQFQLSDLVKLVKMALVERKNYVADSPHI